MKASIIAVLFLALFVAVISSCDPDGNGKPDCSGVSSGVKSRNNWDPTHYWECNGSGSVESVQCPQETGYLAAKNGCVPWSEWEWVPPCPESD